MNYRKSAFTLVELMVVIVIIAALMLIALPTFQGADRGGRLRTASFQLTTTMTLARQAAITSRRYVYLLFPDNTPALFAGQPREAEKAFRAYAPFARTPVSQYLGEWSILPPGVVFTPAFRSDPTDNRNLFLRAEPVEVVPFPTTNGPNVEISTVAFRPDGATTMGNTAFAVYVTEGTVPADLTAGTADLPQARSNAPVIEVNVHPLTGRIRSREYTP